MKLDIINYILSNLEEEKTNDKIVVSMNEDDNKEPFIDITYINKDGIKGGLTSNFENLKKVKTIANEVYSVFKARYDESIVPVVYDPLINKFNLIRMDKDGSYRGNKFHTDSLDAFFVGYIIDNKDKTLDYETKVEKLYDTIKFIMAYINKNLARKFIFKVKDNELKNIYFSKTWDNGFEANNNQKESNSYNIDLISSAYGIDLNTKKLIKK